MYRLKIFLATLFIVFLANTSFAEAMRCGNHLINEGDSRIRMLELCGIPISDTYSNVIYKNGDGFTYYIHLQANGIIDDIHSTIEQ